MTEQDQVVRPLTRLEVLSDLDDQKDALTERILRQKLEVSRRRAALERAARTLECLRGLDRDAPAVVNAQRVHESADTEHRAAAGELFDLQEELQTVRECIEEALLQYVFELSTRLYELGRKLGHDV